MAWFKNIINNIIRKIASKEEIKNKALEQLQQQIPSFQVASQFIRDMSRIDPNFSTGPWTNMIMDASGDSSTLSDAISNYIIEDVSQPSIIEQPIEATPLESPGVTPEEEGRISPEDVDDANSIEENKTTEEIMQEAMDS